MLVLSEKKGSMLFQEGLFYAKNIKMKFKLKILFLGFTASLCIAKFCVADIIISEILASNDSGIIAEDGQRYDWIELYNSGNSPVNISGWHLTDDASSLSKWTFPNLIIEAKSFLLIFASGLDLTNNLPYLHTNFKLSSNGEYVGLTSADGSTIIDEIAPAFPPLTPDRSFGVPMTSIESILLGHNVPVRVLIPQNDSLGDSWKQETFDDSSWTSGFTAVGYDRGPDYTNMINTDVSSMYNIIESCYIRQDFIIEDYNNISSIQLKIKFDDGFVAYINGQEIASSGKPTPLLWNSGATVPDGDPGALVYEPFSIPVSPKILLHEGTNSLAIQGLNYNVGSSDFLIEPQIILQKAEIDSLIKSRLISPTPGTANSEAIIIPEPGVIPKIFINEIMAQNGRSFMDENWNFERDWFELFNAEPTNINLSGYYLTDEPLFSQKWRIPDGTIIPPGGFLIYWADGDDIDPNHCNFSLSTSGETLTLSTPATQIVDQVSYGALPRDISFGRFPDGTDNWYFYDLCTPLQPNGAPGLSQINSQLSQPTFSVDAGVQSNNFDLIITSSMPGADIHYTLDGSLPRIFSPLYSSPLKINTNPGHLLFADNFGRDFALNGVYNETVTRSGSQDEAFRFRGSQRMTDYTSTTDDQITIPKYEDLLYIVASPDGAAVSPLNIFTQNASTTGYSYTVEFEIKQIQGTTKAGVVVGSNSSKNQADDSNGIGFRMDANGNFEVFDGSAGANVNLNSSNLNLFTDFGIINDGNFLVSVEYFVADFIVNSHPLISIKIDGVEIFSFTASGDLNSNYISLNCTYAGGADGAKFDSLMIKSLLRDVLPTPTIIRSRTFKNDYIPSEATTRSWLENRNYSLPVISLAIDQKYLWDDNIGIYVVGTNGIPGRGYPYDLNWNQDWRRPMHIELFESNGMAAISQDAGVKIFANTSRHRALKSLAFYAKDFYGKNSFDHQIFPDRKAASYTTFILRNSSQGSSSFFRDAMKWDFVKDVIDVDIQAYRPISLFINGAYWGIMNMRDKMNEYYAETYYGEDPDKVDLIRGHNFGARAGNSDHYRALIEYIRANDMSLSNSYDYVKTQMEVDQFINYQIFMIWMANLDWPWNNCKYWRPQTPDGRWRWMVYDTDISFWGGVSTYIPAPWQNTLRHATFDVADWPPEDIFHTNEQSTELFNALFENNDFKKQFVQHYAVLLSSMFKPERINGIIDRLQARLEPEMPIHIERWQGLFDPASISVWRNNIQILKDFAIQRPPYCYTHMLEKFGWETNDLTELLLDVPDKNIGSVRINNTPLSTNIYDGKVYKNMEFKIQARPANGYRFLGWSGIPGNNYDETVLLTDSAHIIPIFAPIESPVLKVTPNKFDFELNWKSYFNDFYEIEHSDNLSSDFNSLEKEISSTPPENSFSISNSATAKFYRLNIKPPPEW